MKTIVDYATKVKEQHALNKTLAPVETDLTDASRAYAIGEQFINDGDLFKAKTAIAQHDALVLDTNYEAADDITTQIKNKTVTTDPVPTEGSTNPVQSNGVFVENRNIYEVMGQMGAKNLITYPHSGKTETKAGITFTENADGSVTVNGTATELVRHLISSQQFEVGKKYILSGCPSGGSHSSNGTYTLYTQTVQNYDDGEGVEFTWDASITGITIAVFAGITVDNLTFYPMIRLASDTDSTYQPYTKTNQQLTAENEALTNQIKDMNNVYGSKNLLPFNVADIIANNTLGTWSGNNYTIGGITFTLNDDGSVTVNGTSTVSSTIFLYLVGDSINLSGYKLSGSYRVSTQNYISEDSYLRVGITAGSYSNIREATTMSFPQNSDIYAAIRINSGEIIDNVTLYPMIRLASITDDTYEPYAKTNRELTAENQTLTNKLNGEVETRAKLSAHNLFNLNLELIKANNTSGTWNDNAYTINGITFTINSDKTVNVDTNGGTASANTTFIIDGDSWGQSWTECIVSGCPASGSSGTYRIAVNDGGWQTGDTGNGYESSGTVVALGIWVKSGQTLSNVVFEPMVRSKSDPSTEFTPYAMTNRELTESATITSDTSTLFKYHKVNSIVTMQLVGQQTYADIKNLTIPVGFRPNSIVTVLGYCVSGTSRYLGVVNFNPNGAISIGKIVNDAFTTPSDSDSFEFSTCYYAGN